MAARFEISDTVGLATGGDLGDVKVCPATSQKVACPGGGKLLAVRVLSEKHVCDRTPRNSCKVDPEKLLERRKLAAKRRFEARMARRRSSLDLEVTSEQV
jgi:hypothetical protein